jgi:NAD+ synthase (glutamine-hydrolysing)
MKLTIAQLNFTIGDIDGNISKMASAALQAKEMGADVVVFSELSLTAYYPADLLDDSEFIARLDKGLESLQDATRDTPDLYWVVGAPTRNPGRGKAFRNSLLIFKNGVEVKRYHKQLLPTYNIFDERRHFEPGPDQSCVLRIGDTTVGVIICEDGWNDREQDYSVNPFQRLADASPDLVISINASPSNIGKREQRHQVFAEACRRHDLCLAYVNQVGGHDQLVYDGASFLMTPTQGVAFECARFAEDLQTFEFDPESRSFGSASGKVLCAPEVGGLPTMEFYRQQIVMGLRDYARRCGFSKVVVGSSGGIDSALTLALAVEALGAENVVAITMPSAFSSAGSVDDSVALCENLGVQLYRYPIRPLVESYQNGFSEAVADEISGLTLENLQARIRGTILMAYSNKKGHLLLTTGNKSEIAVGYCTLYGDTNGGLGLIGDLFKTEVFALSQYLNDSAGTEIIPEAIIGKEPSAELAPGQKDTDSLPPYEVLDEILKYLVEGSRLAQWEYATAVSKVDSLRQTPEGVALISRIKSMIARNEYKRRQAPPTIRVRALAFGAGRQMPIAAKHY